MLSPNMINPNPFILSISNGSCSIYEINNLTHKREEVHIVYDLNQIINQINQRYNTKEDTVIVAKIINTSTKEQLTIEIILHYLNMGIFLKISNPEKNIIFNTDHKNYYMTKDIKDLFPINIEKMEKYELFGRFFNN